MSAVDKLYTREMYENFGYFATWVPTVQVRLGDVGIFHGPGFERVTSLRDEGIPFEVRDDGGSANLEYTSADAVSIQLKAAGAVPAAGSAITQADAGITIAFNRANAVVFQATGCTTASIANQAALGDEIISRVLDGTWREDYVVVTEVITTKAATIVISSGRDARCELLAKAQVQPAAITLADIGADLRVAYTSNIGTKIIAEKELTPLFKASWVKWKFFAGPTFERKRSEDAQFVEMNYSDLLDTEDQPSG
jgi:hypothetical protein